MPYVQRDATGKIIALFAEANAQAQEFCEPLYGEVQSFLQAQVAEQQAEQTFAQSDADLIRVLDDLIDVLVEKGLMRFTDLPSPAQEKLLSRKRMRARQATSLKLFE